MKAETLAYINKTLTESGIVYAFSRLNGEIPESYWIGEYTETESDNEDGMTESDFILTGTTDQSWIRLQNEKEFIERLLNGKTLILESGMGITINYDRSLIIPTETEELKRIQLNFSVKEWRNY